MKKWKLVYYLFLLGLILYLGSPRGGTWFYLHNIRWLYVFLLSFLLANFVTPITRQIARQFKILDYPDKRKIHTQPIPLLGGLAIYLAFMIAVLRNLNFSRELWGVVLGGTLVFLLGLVDDLLTSLPASPAGGRSGKGLRQAQSSVYSDLELAERTLSLSKGLSAKIRFFGQVFATLLIIAFGVRVTVIPHWPGEYVMEVLITIFGVVGITNAMNFFDGMDGLATGLTAVCVVSMLIVGIQMQEKWFIFLCAALIGASLGFLPYNFKPASIFLGDAGATFLGFMVAALAIMGSWGQVGYNPMVATATPIIILGVLIFDMIYTTISRIRNGTVHNFREWLEYTGKDHLHHRLVHLGLTEKETVIFIYALALALGLGAVVLRTGKTVDSVLLLIQATIIFLIVTVLMIVGQKEVPGKK